MSDQPGNPRVLVNATVALGAAGGVNIPLESSVQVLTAVSIVYTATGGAGSRLVTVRVLDSASRVFWSAVFATAVTAGQVPRLMMGAGIAAGNVTTPLQQTYPIPDNFSLPAGATLQILDAANIDTADTVQVNVVVTL